MKKILVLFIIILFTYSIYYLNNIININNNINCNSSINKKRIVRDLEKISDINNIKIVKIYDGLLKKNKNFFKKICYIKLSNNNKKGRHTFIKNGEYIIEYIIENNSSNNKIKSYFKIK